MMDAVIIPKILAAAALGSACLPMIPLYAQGAPPVSVSKGIRIDVVVADKSKQPVTTLQPQDFTLLDDKTPQPITSFKAVNAAQQPPRIFIVIDAINLDYSRVSGVRQELLRFLNQNNGHLTHATTIAVVTDRGLQIPNNFTSDGSKLAAWLQNYPISIRDIDNSSGTNGAVDRMQMSLVVMNQLIVSNTGKEPRTALIWISPGWPLLLNARILPNTKQKADIYSTIANLSTLSRDAHLTLYQVNPLGPNQTPDQASTWEMFLKPVSKPADTNYGNLALPILAVQSGGLVLHDGSNIAAMLDHCFSDLDFHYELTFDPRPGELPNSYHHIEVKVDTPGTTARTRDGYYVQH